MCEKDLIDIFSASLTPIVALVAVYIAFQQWRTAERKRKQDLFDRRFDFYQRIWHLYSKHSLHANHPRLQEEDLIRFSHECEFLFGKDIVEHLFKMPQQQQKDYLDYDWFAEPFKKYMKL